MPLQQAARSSPGTLITSMQLARAVADGILIPWRKAEPEHFKTAAELLTIDKGGLTFMPPIGLHTQVAEVDFASMYPTIMAIHNISPETVNCTCCSGERAKGGRTVASGQWPVVSTFLSEDHSLSLVLPSIPVGATRRVAPVWHPAGNDPVPEAGYHLCRRREGLVPRTLRPILALREHLKARAQELPPAEAAPYKQRQTALKWMLVTCFGYLGYKNARFGKIEAHEAVTAYGRDKLLCAKEIFEAAGFTMLHGLTDCLWVQNPGLGSRRGGPACPPSGEHTRGCVPTRSNSLSSTAAQYQAELEDLCAQVSRTAGVRLALEGVYRWVYFMASKQDPQRPVATRYFGVFADGSLKVRGLMCRRRDTPPFVRRAQEAMLAKMAQAATPGELAALRPELEEMAEGFRQQLREGGINPRELVITRVLSQPVADYKVDTPTALAARQLEAAGIHIQPGEKVRYVHREGKRGPRESRVAPAPFIETLDGYDTTIYLELLERALAEVMLPLREY
jgi:DNA polymerase-2